MITTIQAVNRILTFLGESPVSSVATPKSPSVAGALEALDYAAKSLSARAHFWNTEPREVTPDTTTYEIRFGPEVVQVIPWFPQEEARFALRGDQLWDVLENTGTLTDYGTFYVRVVRTFDFDDLPGPAKMMALAEALQTMVAPMGDAALLAAADRELFKAKTEYGRFCLPPGRVPIMNRLDIAPYSRAFYPR